MDRRRFVVAAGVSPFAMYVDGVGSRKDGTEIVVPDEAFMATLPRLMELAELPGLGIGVVRGGKPVWQHYAGVANAKTKEPITAESIFPAASMGKPVFAYAVLGLVDEGKLDLDRPLKECVGDDTLGGEYGGQVTARHVLSHTTGFPNWRNDPGAKLESSFAPGTQFRYSGEGFYLLQRCVEKITGAGCEEWMQERMMRPLGMRSSTYLWNEQATKYLVAGHRGKDSFYNRDFQRTLYGLIVQSGKPLGTWNHDAVVAAMTATIKQPRTLMPNEISPNVAFGMLTTVNDYSAFVGRLVSSGAGKPELKAATRTEMMQQKSRINSAMGWGLGVGTEDVGGRRYLWQWGDNGGWKNFVLAHPESGSGIVVFTNGGNGMRVVERVMRAATGLDEPVFLWV